ncbi:site-specific integrase [Embleya sp. NPDC020630]|uniref:site-specific integrase n=1 Tax=Embleya sp. NPDC020630 TaxID=3363979 RepID=UPI003795347F
MTYFSPTGWESWGLSNRPTIPELMPVLVDEDLRFEDAAGPRATTVLNRWLQELPVLGVPAPESWETYARVARDWTVFLAERGILLFDTRKELRRGLSAYSAHRASGPVEARFAASTWNQHVSILSALYGWAVDEELASAVPFTYKQAVTAYGDQVRMRSVNMARRRMPKPHVTIKYFEGDFEDLFVKGLAGLCPDGSEDLGYRGRTTARNAAVGGFALSSGMRRQEFTYLLRCEVPALPRRRSPLPIRVPVPAGITKGRKFRTTWTTYDALSRLHQYFRLQRTIAATGSSWSPPLSWGDPLVVTNADPLGGRVNGERVTWAELTLRDRRLLVAPEGGSMLLALQADGSPFLDWGTVFKRTSQRLRERFEPRFPHTAPHRCRHTFAIRTLELLVGGYYAQAAKLVKDTDADAALALYLSRTDPVMVLRDLLGHSSVLTTEVYLRRLDTTRIYRDAYERAGRDQVLLDAAELEADDEFDEDDDI